VEVPGIEAQVQFFYMQAPLLIWVDLERRLDLHPETWVEFTKQEIYDRLSAGHLQLWQFTEGGVMKLLVMTQQVVYPTWKELQVVWCDGSFSRFLPYVEWGFDKALAATKCDRVTVTTPRFGWEKRLKRFGFRKKNVSLVRMFKPETMQ
jgi:hypothetical protein